MRALKKLRFRVYTAHGGRIKRSTPARKDKTGRIAQDDLR
jgi:hypothetical protein